MTTVAVAGKGGTGKTTIAGFLVRYLVDMEKSPVLAIDCDPNTNLNEVLGVTVRETVGSIREKALSEAVSPSMTKQEVIEYRMQTSLVESARFDLLAMGVPEGPGCYCFSNSVIRACIEKPYSILKKRGD